MVAITMEALVVAEVDAMFLGHLLSDLHGRFFGSDGLLGLTVSANMGADAEETASVSSNEEVTEESGEGHLVFEDQPDVTKLHEQFGGMFWNSEMASTRQPM